MGHETEVSVKLFKDPGSDTGIPSDGGAGDEIAVSSFIGTSVPTTTQVLARIKDDPPGLVYKYINNEYKTLGKVPSIETVSRDTYDSFDRFDAAFIRNVLTDIAAALFHLHADNISHGDVYAHNIFVAEDGHALLSDFGASFAYAPKDTFFEKFEVRAWAILAKELLDRRSGGLGVLGNSEDLQNFLKLCLL